RGEEQPARFERSPRMLAAGARIVPVDVANRTITALIDLIGEIDRQHRGTASHPNLTAIGLIELDDLLIHDVLPAMIFKIAHRFKPPGWTFRSKDSGPYWRPKGGLAHKRRPVSAKPRVSTLTANQK